MDASFSAHLDQLIGRLKLEVVQHYERDCASIKASIAEKQEAALSPVARPQFLRLTAGKKVPGFESNEVFFGKSPYSPHNWRPTAADSDSSEEFEPHSKIHRRLASKSAASDVDVSDRETVTSTDSLELKTPKGPYHPPHLPDAFHPKTPAATPAALFEAKAPAPEKELPEVKESPDSDSEELANPTSPPPAPADFALPATPETSPPVVATLRSQVSFRRGSTSNSLADSGGSGITAQPKGKASFRRGSTSEGFGDVPTTGANTQTKESIREEEVEAKKSGKSSCSSSSSSSSGSSASFASSSDEEHVPPMLNSRLTNKRPSNVSLSAFFKREPAVSRVWLFLEDPDSSSAAGWYALTTNYLITATILFTIWQAGSEPFFSKDTEAYIQLVIEVLMCMEFITHFVSSSSKKAFCKNPYNFIDFAALIPLGVRSAYGLTTPAAAENLIAHSILVCYVPVVRQLKLIRRFQKLQLLLHVLSTTLDALKLLLFLVCLIVLFFGTMLYIAEPVDTTTLPTYIYWCTVTVTTVGTCDMAPVTWSGKVMAGILCLISVLFMAMPLSVLGNAMSKTWDDRHRILLMTQTRRRLKHLGYSADDMPKLFKKFDRDGNGELEMEEFCVGVKPAEASELFMAFDFNGDGGIDEREFMKALFPLDYRRIYRRASGMTFGA